MEKIKVLVFDADGTLFDSLPVVKEVLLQIIGEDGLRQLGDFYKEYPPKETIKKAKELELIKGDWREIYNKYKEKLLEKAKRGEIPIIVDVGLLEKAKNKYKLAILTNGLRRYISIILKDILHLFDVIVTSEDVSFPKPDPEGLIKIASFFSVKPEDILLFGDTEVDEETAKNANAKFIKVDRVKTVNYHLRKLVGENA